MSTNDIFSHMGVSEHIAPALRAAAYAARAHEDSSAMTHAWLFTGPPGSGRSVAAVAFAAALECEDPHVAGCGQCPQCRSVIANAHADVVHIVPRELSISVETMRAEVVEPAAKRPTVGRWRVVILDNADRLTDGAANALLKTVEEPPAHTVIMLCAPSTDPTDIIPTLLSRSRHVYVPQPTTEQVVAVLTRDGSITEQDAQLAAASSGGHIGRARWLARDVEAQRRRASILNMAELVFHGDQAFQAVTGIVKTVTKQVEEQLSQENDAELDKLRNSLGMGARGKGVHKALRGYEASVRELEERQKKRRTRAIRDSLDLSLVDLAGLYRDAIMVSSRADVARTHPDMVGLAEELAQQVSAEGLVACVDTINLCREHINHNVRPEVAFDAMIGRIRLACGAR
ncbi:DNA polymerase III subunit delta' [Corynebacterium ramonii]|uniref:DNA polymerase III subunit gamma/tau n=1 Tax=Corynebacterium ramonii TaxID=3026968 RepID=A0ABN4EFN9_9CORY|nr:DNA polymerase III subunit delta' [Corynebacterium ramonii]AIU31868.1 DNA polymerase III subunit gamma/tau [Corynebacterium ramonii FRC0011]